MKRARRIISGPAVRIFDEQYAQWKPSVEVVVRAQERLCARLSFRRTDGLVEEAQRPMVRIRRIRTRSKRDWLDCCSA